jgi:hypothetical protein
LRGHFRGFFGRTAERGQSFFQFRNFHGSWAGRRCHPTTLLRSLRAPFWSNPKD